MTALYEGVSGVRVMTDASVQYPAWQPGRKISITATVGGFAATLLAGVPPSEASGTVQNASQVSSFLWNGVQFCRAPDSGSGTGFELYVLNSTAENTQHTYNCVEAGKSGETPPLDTMTNLIAQGFSDASGRNMVRVVKPCFWIGPGQFSGANLSKALRDVSETVNTITYTWGLAGNDHIIQIDNSIVLPTDATVQARTQLSLVPLYHYAPNLGATPFTTQEWVDLTTGATRAYASDTSTTEVLMCKTSDDAFACALVYGSGLIGGGWHTGLNGTGAFPFVSCYGWCVKSYPSGIPAGTVRAPTAFCFGSRADLIGSSGAIVTAALNLPSASYP